MTGKTSRILQQAVRYARTIGASRIEIVGHRGATLLSSGEVMTEQTGIAERRAKQVAELLTAVGVETAKLNMRWEDTPAVADGAKDFEHRRVVIVVKP